MIERTYKLDELIPATTFSQFSKHELMSEVERFFKTAFKTSYPAFTYDGLRVFVKLDFEARMDDEAKRLAQQFLDDGLMIETNKYFR